MDTAVGGNHCVEVLHVAVVVDERAEASFVVGTCPADDITRGVDAEGGTQTWSWSQTSQIAHSLVRIKNERMKMPLDIRIGAPDDNTVIINGQCPAVWSTKCSQVLHLSVGI